MEQLFSSVSNFDKTLFFLLLASLRTPYLNKMMIILSWLGNNGLVWLIILFLVALKGGHTRGKTALLGVLSLLTGWLVSELAKHLFTRPRPFTQIKDVHLLVNPPGGYSFPSGHTTIAFAVAMVIFLRISNTFVRGGVLLLAGLIGFSRIYLGVHYPGDILGGLLLGCLIAISIIYVERKSQQNKDLYIIKKIPPL